MPRRIGELQLLDHTRVGRPHQRGWQPDCTEGAMQVHWDERHMTKQGGESEGAMGRKRGRSESHEVLRHSSEGPDAGGRKRQG